MDDGQKIHGHYDMDGCFIVEVNDRSKTQTDRDGFLVDKRGSKIADDTIRERFRVRAMMSPQQDEFVAVDASGKEVGGRFNKQGFFIVDVDQRSQQMVVSTAFFVKKCNFSNFILFFIECLRQKNR